jgi:hypothetical protein
LEVTGAFHLPLKHETVTNHLRAGSGCMHTDAQLQITVSQSGFAHACSLKSDQIKYICSAVCFICFLSFSFDNKHIQSICALPTDVVSSFQKGKTVGMILFMIYLTKICNTLAKPSMKTLQLSTKCTVMLDILSTLLLLIFW